jgi:aerobic carbon-monoxide dehydrogenase small subunit
MRDQQIEVEVNGQRRSLSVEPRLLLVHLLRENLSLTGTHVGCDTSSCGACTVLLDGRSVKSCTILAVQADGRSVTTIEGIGDSKSLHPMQEAFWAEHGLQCGYCTTGMIMSAVDVIQRNPDPTDEQIREGLGGNVCRCTGYHNIVRAVKAAAKATRDGARRKSVAEVEPLTPPLETPPPSGEGIIPQRQPVGASGGE